MPMIALAAFSAYQGVQASNAAKDDANKRDAAGARAEALGKEDRDYYRKKFGPVNQMLIDYAMGNKPSPYLAKAKGRVEEGYRAGMQQLRDISGRAGLGMSGIGEGQKIGLGMERVKTLAGLDLSDQAQRYGVAQSLSQMENNSQNGTRVAADSANRQAGYYNSDMQQSLGYANSAFEGAAKGFANYDYGIGKAKATQTDRVERGGTTATTGGTAGGGLNREEM